MHSAGYIRSILLSAARCREVGFTTSHSGASQKRRKMQKRALFLVLVLTSCDVKRLTYANEYSIAISHKEPSSEPSFQRPPPAQVVGVPVQLKAAEIKVSDSNACYAPRSAVKAF